MFGVGGFKSAKCKTLLRLAMARIKLLRNKRDVVVKQMRKDIAQLLATGQDPSARIRVEHINREQNIMAAYDLIELFCELIIVRLPIIESNKVVPGDLKEAVASLMFAGPRCSDLPELQQIRTLFTAKYGKEFVAAALELRPECGVNRRVIEKLSVRAPTGETKLKLLMEIAAEHHINWDHEATLQELLKQPEDLLDAPKKFFGASEAPIPDPRPSPPKPNEAQPSISDPQRATIPPPARPLPPAVHRSTQQHLPPSPPTPKQPSPQQPSPPTAGRNNSPNVDPNAPHLTRNLNNHYRDREEARLNSQSQSQAASYHNVAAAAQAAAQSADRAVAAARAAAQLAQSHPFRPEQPQLHSPSKPPSKSTSQNSREQQQQHSPSQPPSKNASQGSRQQQQHSPSSQGTKWDSPSKPPSRSESQGTKWDESSSDEEDSDDDDNRGSNSRSSKPEPGRGQPQQQQQQGRGNVYVTSDSYFRNGNGSGRR